MDPDQELCLCFHVTVRKVRQFIRQQRPRVSSQLSQCYGAGTGCGWCRPFLTKLLQQSQQSAEPEPPARSNGAQTSDLAKQGENSGQQKAFSTSESVKKGAPEIPAQQYRAQRAAYLRNGGRQPPS